MYNEILFDFSLVEERFEDDYDTLQLLKPVRNLLLNESKEIEIISELIYVLNNINTYREEYLKITD